jgi:quinol monooxygenase YgiN
MIQATLRLKLGPNNVGAAVKVLRSLLERTRVVPGSLGCHLYQDLEEPGVLLFEERWQTRESLEKHLRSDRYRQVLLVMEAAVEPPEVRFDLIKDSTGLETVEQARIR